MKRPLAIAASFFLVFTLGGCSDGSDPSVALPEKAIDRWALPLDAYTYASASVRDYAEALLDSRCYAESGIDWPVPWQPEDRDMKGPSFSAGGMRIFNLALATEYGYHTAPKTFEGFAQWRDFTIAANQIAAHTPGFDSVSKPCLERTRKQFPLPSEDTMYYAVGATNEIYDKALMTDEMTAATREWLTCMSSAGVGGYAETPENMPGDAMMTAWDVPNPSSTAGEEERAVAVADVACRTESGWTDALYVSMWDQQAAFVESNADRLTRIRQEIEGDREALLQVIAENAPSK